MKTQSDASCFAEAARVFCEWAEAVPEPSEAAMLTARRQLSRLYSLALDLSILPCGDEDAPAISHEAWQTVFRRFGTLPVSYYGSCFDPLTMPADEPTLGDLADDLADIWRDLKEGLMLFDAGHVDSASFSWGQSFHSHWGRHAASALYVVHCWAETAGPRPSMMPPG